MFAANADREEVFALSNPGHGEAVQEVEDFFRRRRWLFQPPSFALSERRRDMAAAWVLDIVPDVPVVEQDRLAVGLFHSTGHYHPKVYAGFKSNKGAYAAVRKVRYAHKKTITDMLRQWREVAFDNAEILAGLRNYKIKPAEVEVAALKAAKHGLLPWDYVGRICKEYGKGDAIWCSWSAVSTFMEVIGDRPASRQMEQTVGFIKELPINKDWVSIPEE